MHKCSDENHNLCENNTLCHLCDGKRLFKRPKWMDRADKQKEREAKKREQTFLKPKKEKEGMGFEKRVAKRYNKKVTQTHTSARRRPNSGAIWSMPGDIVTEEGFLFECKERGSVTSRGEKTISIHKDWLDKVTDEAISSKKKYWALPFGFKESDEVYIIKDYNTELEMIQTIKILKDRIIELENGLVDENGTNS